MSRSIARRSSLQMSTLSILGVVMVAVISYKAICMWQDMRHQDTLSRAASSVEQILARNGSLPASEMWSRVDELLLSLVNVRAKVHGADGQVLYGPQVLLGQVDHKVTHMHPLSDLGGSMPMAGLELALDVSEDHRFLTFIAWLFAGVAVLWAVFIVLISGTLARFELKPLNNFSRKISEFDPSDLTSRIANENAPDELNPVIEQFNNLMAKVAQYHEQLRSFNSNVAHELNTPLSSLTVSHELLLREKNLDKPVLQEALHSHLEELQRMNRIIQSMLFLSHVSQGQYREFQSIQLNDPVLAVLSYMEAILEDRRLTCQVSGEAQVHADPELIKRAFSNLLSNAVRYAEEGSTIQVRIEPQTDVGRVQLTVCNTGVGIPKHSIPHLFEPFYRVDQSRTESQHNHGLGLAIVAAIARLHGGEPFVHCEEKQVCVGFSVSLVE